MRKALTVMGIVCVLASAIPAACSIAWAAPQSISIMADTPLSLAILQRLAPLMERAGAIRVLPVAGKGPVATVTDLATLHDVDAALVSSDTLAYMQKNGLSGPAAGQLAYVVRLGSLDVHVVARDGIETLGDLAGKRLVVGRTSGESFAIGEFLRGAIEPPPVILPGDGLAALQAVSSGKADAAILIGHRPMPELASLGPNSGLHLIGLESPKGFEQIYAPSLISHDDYPNLVPADRPVETIAAALTVAVFNSKAGSEPYKRVRAIADALFAALQPSPGSDAGLNLAAAVPGWNRHGAATEALAALPGGPQQ